MACRSRPRAADGPSASHPRGHGPVLGRSGEQARLAAFVQSAGAIGLNRGLKCADRLSLGARLIPTVHSQKCARIGCACPICHPGHWHPGLRPLLTGDAQRADRVRAQIIDPVGAGFIENLTRPGAYADGALLLSHYSISGEWLGLLKEIAPKVKRVAVLRDRATTCRDRPVCRHPIHGTVARGGGERG